MRHPLMSLLFAARAQRWAFRSAPVSSAISFGAALVESRFGITTEHNLRLRHGVISYRSQMGDLQSIREVLADDVYRLRPEMPAPATLVDFGANIGMASLFYAWEYGVKNVIAVEPQPGNLELLRRNLAANVPAARIVPAAVGASAGTATFAESEDSNAGRLSPDGSLSVRVEAAANIVTAELERPVLLKVDIEGGEADLFSGHLGWLRNVDGIIIEFHPAIVPCEPIIDTIAAAGFRHIPREGFWMDCFVADHR